MEERAPAAAAKTLSLGSRIARGAAWMVVLRSADRFLGFASMLVLARLLVPADFGLVALGMAVVGSLAAFSEFSFDLALIQNQSAERKHYDTAWTLGLLRGVLIAGLLLLVAGPAADAMGDARLAALIQVLALIPLLEGLTNIGVVDFRKELVFSKEFLYRFSSRVGGVIVTLCLAFWWRDYWALVAGQLTTGALRLALSYFLHPYRPRISLAAWRDLFHFSKWLFFNGIAQFTSRRASTFVVGAFLSPTAVGLLTLSEEITGLVSQAFITPVKRTFFPGFAKIAEDVAAMREMLLRAYALTVAFAMPASLGIGLTADLFVPLILGPNWLEIVPIIEVLVYAALAQSLQGPARPLLLALNRPELVTAFAIMRAAILLSALIIGTSSAGIIGSAWAVVAASVAMIVLQFIVIRHFLRISLGRVAGAIWRPVVSCGLMVLALWWLKAVTAATAGGGAAEQFLILAFVIAAGALSYVLGLLALWWISGRPTNSAEGAVLQLLQSRLGARKQQPGN